MSPSIDTLFAQNLKVSYVAHSLKAIQRQEMAIQAVGGNTPIAHVAKHYGVSRKFVYQQKQKALDGIAQAFEEEPESDDKVLFYIPVTKKWLMQVILGLIFICRASYQGVVEFLRDIMDYKISKGTVGNIVYRYLIQVKAINSEQELSHVNVGLHDEIYQTGKPVLVGCCAHSTYCYLLQLEDVCDANSWGVHLLDLKEKQGLAPDFTVIDGGAAARKGQKDAWEDIPAHGDVFHALKPFLAMVNYVENRAMNTLKYVEQLKHKIKCPRGKWRLEHKQSELSEKLLLTEEASKKELLLADDLNTLYRWLKNDILSLVGPSFGNRQSLLHFVVKELETREDQCRHKIEPVRKYLENHSSNLLEFVPILEMKLYAIAETLEVPLEYVKAIYELKGFSTSSQRYWEREARLRSDLGENFHKISLLLNEVLDDTVRANSLVENINSRLRTYFTLRKELGNDYLSFLQFFLNHRRFMRSEYTRRVGKSPCELMTGKEHKHWLEMLGFDLFKQAA